MLISIWIECHVTKFIPAKYKTISNSAAYFPISPSFANLLLTSYHLTAGHVLTPYRLTTDHVNVRKTGFNE